MSKSEEREYREQWEREAYEEQVVEDEAHTRFWHEAMYDPTSDAYYSSGAREARIDAGLEKPATSS